MILDKLAGPVRRRLHTSVFHPVIVEAKPGAFESLYGEVMQYELTRYAGGRRLLGLLADRLDSIPFTFTGAIRRFNMLAGLFPSDVVEYLGDHPLVKRVYYDRPLHILPTSNTGAGGPGGFPTVPPECVYSIGGLTFTSTYCTRRVIGADRLEELGYRGQGVKVAVPDTGVMLYHEQLGLRFGTVKFDTVMPAQQSDGNGHGSWCVTAIGGGEARVETLGSLAGAEVRVKGVAPDVELYAIKCLGYLVGTGSNSQIIKAVELALDWGADIISMSLGGAVEAETPEDDPFYSVMERVIEEQAIPVVAAGNEGPAPGTIGTPGAMPQVITVGAYDPITGRLADFSSRGPTPWGDTKPDIVAPGVNIVSGSTGMLDVAVDKVADHYAVLSGTSMATPHAAGLIALFREAYARELGTTLTAGEVKRMMESWATEHGVMKSPETGWGALTADVLFWWLETQYGVRLGGGL